MQDFQAENAALRQLSRHYSGGVISLADYRVTRHSMLQALEEGGAPELPVLEELPEEVVAATISHPPFAESGEWQVDHTVMTAALATNPTKPTNPALSVPDAPAPVATADAGGPHMDANSWTLLIVLLVLAGVVALAVLVYVFKM